MQDDQGACGGPLAGTLIVDLSGVISGPFGTAILADQGADVIMVENPAAPDLVRFSGPIAPGAQGVSAVFAAQNRNKRAISIDMKRTEGHELVLQLLAKADVVVQNSRPGVVDRLGLGWEQLSALNPRLIMCSISGFGPEGPYAQRPVFDPVIQSIAGFCAVQGGDTGRPSLILTGVCDKITSLHAAEAICAALLAREKSGRGQHLEVSMLDVAVHFLWLESMWNHVYLDHTAGMPDFQSIYKLYQTNDGWAVVHGIATEDHWQALCRALGLDELLDDTRFTDLYGRLEHGHDVHRLLQEKTVALSTAALIELLVDAGVPAAPVNTAEQLIEDPQVKHRELLVRTEHPSVGGVRQVRPPVIFSDTTSGLRRHAPRTGEHTDEVLTGLLNLTPAEVTSLRQRDIVS